MHVSVCVWRAQALVGAPDSLSRTGAPSTLQCASFVSTRLADLALAYIFHARWPLPWVPSTHLQGTPQAAPRRAAARSAIGSGALPGGEAADGRSYARCVLQFAQDGARKALQPTQGGTHRPALTS